MLRSEALPPSLAGRTRELRQGSRFRRAGAALPLAIVVTVAAAAAQQPTQPPAPAPPPIPKLVSVKPIDPPGTPLPAESASAGITRFSFIAYGDTRSGSEPGVPGDGQVVHPEHTRLMDTMLARIKSHAASPFPVRFVVQSGDAVLRGANGDHWNVSFTPIIERLTRGAGIPYFFSVGNHDVSGMPQGDPLRSLALHNTLTVMSRLIPPEGSPRRLSGYPTYAVGYGNAFVIALDSNIAADAIQLAWVTEQLEHLDRARYHHIVVVFHHPPFSSGPHGGTHVEPATVAIRERYMPLFRKHHVRMIIAGHDHLYDHWVERYMDNGTSYRLDALVTGGGGAPAYAYSAEPDLQPYVAAGAAQQVAVQHLAVPGPTAADNPRHFVLIQVDGDSLSLEVVAIGASGFGPYNGRSRVDLTDRVS